MSLQAIRYYSVSPHWAPEIEKLREKLNEELVKLPICSRYWRMFQRQQIVERAKRSKGELSVALKALMDAARELGHVDDGGKGRPAVNVQVNLLQHVEQLAPAAALHYAQTGELPPTGKVMIQETRALSSESESVEAKVLEVTDDKSNPDSEI